MAGVRGSGGSLTLFFIAQVERVTLSVCGGDVHVVWWHPLATTYVLGEQLRGWGCCPRLAAPVGLRPQPMGLGLHEVRRMKG